MSILSRIGMRPKISGFDFLPTDLSNLVLWLDASDSSTITESSGFVSQWNDKSGNNNHAFQTDGALQPRIDTVKLNNLNVIEFVSGTDELNLTNEISITDDLSIIYLSMSDNTSQTRMIMGRTSSREKNGTFSGRVFVRLADTSISDSSVNDVGSGVHNLKVITRNKDNKVDLTINNGVKNRLFSDSPYIGTSKWNVIARDNSTTQRWDGTLSEMIVCSSKISNSEESKIVNYFTNKWGVP